MPAHRGARAVEENLFAACQCAWRPIHAIRRLPFAEASGEQPYPRGAPFHRPTKIRSLLRPLGLPLAPSSARRLAVLEAVCQSRGAVALQVSERAWSG